MRFNVSGWSGKTVAGLKLTIDGVSGNAATLVVDETTTSWKESSVTWRSQPLMARELARTPVISGRTATFDVASMFLSGKVDRSSVAISIRNTRTARSLRSARASRRPSRT